jgi:2-hydroxymuconate-semialdehyde hydrolase
VTGYIDIPEGAMAYRWAGAGEVVILLHGIPTSSYLWRNIIPILGERFNVFAPDLLGYGDSAKPVHADLSLNAQATYVFQFLDRLGVERAHFVGHDIGGGIVQLIALRYPDMVAKMVLIDTVAYDAWPASVVACLQDSIWDERIMSVDLVAGFREWLAQGTTRHQQLDDLAALYATPFTTPHGRRAFLRAARALDHRDLMTVIDQIEGLPNETLILWGEHDRFLPPPLGEKLAAAMAGATFELIPNAGHFSPEDAPDLIARRLREFLS